VKQIVAIIKPYLVEKVLEALKHAPVEACEVHEVKGYGRQKSYLDAYRGSEYSLAFLPKVELTLWVDDLREEEVVRAINGVARTGRMGDGKVFILPAAPCDLPDEKKNRPSPVVDLKAESREPRVED
jgi:nitrogen regulatory protein PII